MMRVIAYLIVLVGIVSTYAEVCPKGWIHNCKKSCYKVIEESYTYAEAESACQELDDRSYIAVPDDAEENAFIAEMAPSYVWLGCNTTGMDVNYLWTCADGSGKTFDAFTETASPANSYWNWAAWQPKFYDDQCQVQYMGGYNKWSSWSCSASFQAVCELSCKLYYMQDD